MQGYSSFIRKLNTILEFNNIHDLAGAVVIESSRPGSDNTSRGFGLAFNPVFRNANIASKMVYFALPNVRILDELLLKPKLFQKVDDKTGWTHYALLQNTINGEPIQDEVGRTGNYILKATQFPPTMKLDAKEVGKALMKIKSPKHHGQFENLKIDMGVVPKFKRGYQSPVAGAQLTASSPGKGAWMMPSDYKHNNHELTQNWASNTTR